MGITVVNDLREEQWYQFVQEHPAGNIFHTPEMFQVFSRAKGHQPKLWAAVTTDGGSRQPLALMLPVQVTLMNGLLYGFTTRAILYGSVLAAPGPQGRQALAVLLKAYQQAMRGKILFTELRNLADLNDLQPVLNEHEFVYEDHLNYLIDLDQSEEAIWQNFNKSGRQSVRTSRNKGTVVEEVTDRDKVAVAYSLLCNVYTRVQVPLADLSLFEAAFDILGSRDMFKIFMARVGEEYVGTCVLLIYNGRILYWYAGSDRAFSAYAPAELLIWHTLQWGQQQNFLLFDFGGAGKPNEEYGPRNFKAKFGGRLVNYGRNTCIHAPLRLKFSQTGYQLMRKFL